MTGPSEKSHALRDIWAVADRWRHWLALALLAVAVLFKLNGSSIGMWNQYVPNERAVAPLLGKPRAIRSDEWAVFTPLTLAQSNGGDSAYAYFSEIPRGAKTDMYSVYAQPVRHPLLAFRPFLAGFAFLGFERGLAFFWAARWLALFLVMYALFKRLTSDDRALSAIGAAMVVLSPVVQWWGAINALAEMLIFGGLAVLALDRFMEEASVRRRILPAAGMAYCAVAYAMTLYPGAMVPLGYVFAALAAGMVVRRVRGGFRLDLRTGLVALAAGAAAVAVLAFYVWKSQEAFKLAAGTVYPGARVCPGGGCLQCLANEWGNFILPWTERNLAGNAFERSTFLALFPLGAVVCFAAMVLNRRLDGVAVGLMLVSALLFAYCAFGIPETAAKASLLGRSTGQRAAVAFGFAQLLLLLRGLSLLGERRPAWCLVVLSALAFGIFSTLAARWAYGGYLKATRLPFIAAASCAGCALLLRFRDARGMAAAFFLVLMLLAGGPVNPVQRGTAGVLDSDLAREIRRIVQHDRGLWLVDGCEFPVMEYPIMLGAPTVNSTNVYPARERWGVLDPSGRYESVWNRYSHIRATIVKADASSFRLIQDDYFALDLPNADVARLGVRYVLSPRDLAALSDGHASYRRIGGASGYHIYSVDAAARSGEAGN